MTTPQTPLSLYALVYQLGPAYDPSTPPADQFGRHNAYIEGLRQQGKLFEGGAFEPDVDSYPVLQVPEADAVAILQADPDVASGRLQGQVYRWHPRYGIYPPM